MDMNQAMAWAAERKLGVLITNRSDGRAQPSDIVYAIEGDTFAISVTDDRAKTVNMRRDPRVVLHLSDPKSWSYTSFDGTVELTDVARRPDDAANDALVAYYEATAGQAHPDWDEFRQAMIDERRLIARFRPTSVVGQIH